VPSKTKTPAAEGRKDTNAERQTSVKAGKLWIDPNLNRKVAGPGGNRGAHTTLSAELLKLADIVLKTGR